jgi:hypothetical protein
MADRGRAQKIGAIGHKWVISEIENHPKWLSRELLEDFGIDAEAELSAEGIKGEILKLQFKASEHVLRKENRVKFDIAKRYINYAKSCRYPVIFIRIDISLRQAWYLWLQQWILIEKSIGNELLDEQSTFTTWVDDSQTLRSGLDSALIEIARWRGETQLVLSLLDAMHAATATYNTKVVDQIIALLSETAPILAHSSLDIVLQEGILLGNNLRGTHEGNVIADKLFTLLRKFGGQITVSMVDTMVKRQDSYSRTGITGLSILYDMYGDRVGTLNLIDHFLKLDMPQVAYYCALREANPGEIDVAIINVVKDFVFAGLKFNFPAEDGFMDKYINRGPSAILDYLVLSS